MSLAATGYVFTLQLPATEKWLAVCLADYADDLGESIFPSLETLEAKAGMSRSTVKRTLTKLLQLGVIERVAEATPVSPAFYRIVGVPEPSEVDARAACPNVLRRAVVTTFGRRCEFCGQASESGEIGPDGRPWQILRIGIGARQALYAPHTVTLSCKACVLAKRATRDAGPRTLTNRQRHEAAQIALPAAPDQSTGSASHAPITEGVQIDPSVIRPQGIHPAPPLSTEGSHLEPGGGSDWTGGGFNLNPDPIRNYQERSEDPRAVAAPQPIRPTAADCLSVLTKLAHEAIDSHATASDGDVREHVKRRSAHMRIPYDSTVIGKAVDSARVQRRHRRSA